MSANQKRSFARQHLPVHHQKPGFTPLLHSAGCASGVSLGTHVPVTAAPFLSMHIHIQINKREGTGSCGGAQ